MPNNSSNNKPEPLRAVQLNCFDCLRSEIDALETAGNAHLETTGNWTPAQIVEHLARAVEASLDGFNIKLPLMLRIMKPLIRWQMLRTGFNVKSGIKLSGDAVDKFVPSPDTELGPAIEHLRKTLDRTANEQYIAASPIMGPMTSEQWKTLHLRHAEMHLGFVKVSR